MKYLTENFGLHFDSSNMKRSTTNFDRTFATRQFDQTNKSLRDSQAFRMTQSAFTSSQKKSINK